MTHVPAATRTHPIVYSDAEMLWTLRRLAMGEHTLGRASFLARRRDGDPSYDLYEHRFGTWNAALERAGLVPTDQPIQLVGATTKWTETQLLDALRQCAEETGSSALRTYEAWRTDRPGMPPAATIRARMGSWSHATTLAFG